MRNAYLRTSEIILALTVFLSGCTGPSEPASATSVANPCDNADGAWSRTTFVVVGEPAAGTRVAPGFEVRGCSRTFESNVIWRLLARDGTELARGFTTGGGSEGPASFEFSVDYRVPARVLGHLEVTEPRVTESEGFPPGRTVLPLILLP